MASIQAADEADLDWVVLYLHSKRRCGEHASIRFRVLNFDCNDARISTGRQSSTRIVGRARVPVGLCCESVSATEKPEAFDARYRR